MGKLLLSVSALLSVCLWSCGPNKEFLMEREKSDSLNRVIGQMTAQNNQLSNQITQQQAALAGSQTEIAKMKSQNAVAMQEAYDCKVAKEAVARRMEEFNQALEANGTSMKEIRKKAELALAQFAEAGVEVTYKNGLVYISMQDELLFSPGSAKLGAKGQEALAVVAQVLNDNPNLKIYVVGHTDSVKVTKGFTDNWSLSTERANSVVRVLRDQYQVTMDRVTSAGQGKYDPVADNSTPEGMAKNRRTDIILNPDLSGFWEMIDKQP